MTRPNVAPAARPIVAMDSPRTDPPIDPPSAIPAADKTKVAMANSLPIQTLRQRDASKGRIAHFQPHHARCKRE